MDNKENERVEELRKQYGDNVELRTSEVRAAGDDSLVIEGYAANFDTETDLGTQRRRKRLKVQGRTCRHARRARPLQAD